jgi:cysteinyl-tRNA synthetase
MVPKIIVTNGGLDVHGMARYFEQIHREDSVDVVRFLRKFTQGTLVRDLQSLKNRWSELAALDSERTAARARKDTKESDRLTAELTKIGIALKDSKDPKTGEITTTWEVARRENGVSETLV